MAVADRTRAGAARERRGDQGIVMPAPVPLALLADPLEFILADHYRQRAVCAVMRRIADTRESSAAEIDRLVVFLTRDQLVHHADEDQDLYPRLRQRAQPSDELDATLSRLSEDHRRSAAAAAEIVAALADKRRAGPVHVSRPVRQALRAYAVAEHHHLAIENAVVMVIARVRLGPRDLAAMREGMRIRRGLAA